MTIRVRSNLFGREKWMAVWGRREGDPEALVELDTGGWRARATYGWGHSFGVGFRFGRNGDESDIGLDLYASRLGSLWLRLRSPWTRWVRVDRDRPDWYKARHTSLRFHPFDGCLLSWEIDQYANEWHRSDPWWRRGDITWTTLLGRKRTMTVVLGTQPTVVPMPEGDYPATVTLAIHTTRHVRRPGTWVDKLNPTTRVVYQVEVEGGIPHWGKGENSWDCGMDGVFGGSGAQPDEAVANTRAAALRNRARYGDPQLPHPMTVGEAEQRARAATTTD